MVDATGNILVAERPLDDAGSVDGRRLRAERSRRCIVEALISLIRGGEVMPSAERVSEKANVGLRTVFRHFEDMDSLYQEVADAIDAELRPLMDEPLAAPDWRGQILETIDRRTKAFEWIMPFKVQANARLLQSDFLQSKHRCAVDADIQRLYGIMPDFVRKDATLFAAFSAALSFDVWYRLRQDQGLDLGHAKAAVQRLIEGLIATV